MQWQQKKVWKEVEKKWWKKVEFGDEKIRVGMIIFDSLDKKYDWIKTWRRAKSLWKLMKLNHIMDKSIFSTSYPAFLLFSYSSFNSNTSMSTFIFCSNLTKQFIEQNALLSSSTNLSDILKHIQQYFRFTSFKPVTRTSSSSFVSIFYYSFRCRKFNKEFTIMSYFLS